MSDDHDSYRDDVAAYALGALSEVERTSLERHLQDCDSCSHDLASFRAVLEALSVTGTPLRPREELKQQLLHRIREAGKGEEPRPS